MDDAGDCVSPEFGDQPTKDAGYRVPVADESCVNNDCPPVVLDRPVFEQLQVAALFNLDLWRSEFDLMF